MPAQHASRRAHRLLPFAAAVFIAVTPAIAQDGPRPIEPEDYYRVQRVDDTALSPDGRHLIYTVQTVRRQENDRLTEIWWTDLETQRTQRLTTAGVNSTDPGWTPDGRRIHFTTTRGGESGVHFLNFLEPGGEAYRLRGVTGTPHFAPDGSWILVTRRVGAEDEAGETERQDGRDRRGEATRRDGENRERAGARQRAGEGERDCWPSGTPALTGPMGEETRGRTEEERNCDVYVITHASYKRDGTLAFIPPPADGDSDRERHTQFFRIPADGLAEGEEARQLTFDPVDKSFQDFSPDGRWIIYMVNLTERDLTDEDKEEQEAIPFWDRELPEIGIYRLPAEGGEATKLTTVKGLVRDVRASPDGRRLAFVLTEDRLEDPVIRIIDARNGADAAELARDWKYTIGMPSWSPNGRHIYWVSGIGGQDQVVRVAAEGGPVERVTSGRHTLSGVSFDRHMRRMAYVKSTVERPWEAFVAGIDGTGERQVTRVNEDWLAGVRLSEVERFTYEGVPHSREWLDRLPERGVDYMLANTAPEGERPEIEAWLIYPLDYEPGQRYPLVVSIHGGPHSRYAETWFPEFQMLAAQGMFVLYTNPRGSSHYGMEFQYMTLRAWGIDDTKDILQGVDIVVDRGLADPDRLGITGGSYGGFMTNWITAHDQRWRSALTARSISNWISFYGVSDIPSLIEREFGGAPWPFMSMQEGSHLLATMLSPIVWADRVRTPTLIIHSINDYRTPLEGGEQWYRALTKHDVEVKMVLFPDSSHGLSRTGEPWLLVRRLHEYMDWFRATLVEAEDEPERVVD